MLTGVSVRKLALFFVLGFFVGYWFSERLAEELRPAPRVGRARDTDEESNAFGHIKGIGPVFRQALQDAGIRTNADLAAQDADALAEKLGGRVTGERIRRERWVEQAQEYLNNQ